MSPFSRAVVAFALKQLGLPYIWAGRGDFVLRDGLKKPATVAGVDGGRVYDCSGLVTDAIRAGGGPDLRVNWNADRLWRALPTIDEETADDDDDFRLRFYGTKGGAATHVALTLGNGLVIEAAGGDSRTLTYRDAVLAGAAVGCHFESRKDVLGTRSLNAARRLKP